MSAPVFFLSPVAAQAAAPGGSVILDGAEGRHAGVVQRLGVGEKLELVDGAGTRILGTVAAVRGEHVVVDVVDVSRDLGDGYSLILVQALAKGGRDELAIEMATEVGVDGVIPWQAERSIVQWKADRRTKSHSKWVHTVHAATKQARRAVEPNIEDLCTTTALATRIEEVTVQGGLALVLHEAADLSLDAVIEPLIARDAPGQILVIVGPEGGIGDGEVTRFEAAGAVTVKLGPHVMRTSTAGAVAVAVLSKLLGRWDS